MQNIKCKVQSEGPAKGKFKLRLFHRTTQFNLFVNLKRYDKKTPELFAQMSFINC